MGTKADAPTGMEGSSMNELGITNQQLAAMQRRIDVLERENDAIGHTRIRHAVNDRLVEIRLLLRDGHLKNKNTWPCKAPATLTPGGKS